MIALPGGLCNMVLLVSPGHIWPQVVTMVIVRSGTFTMMALIDIKAPWPLIRNCPEQQQQQEEQESEKCVTC